MPEVESCLKTLLNKIKACKQWHLVLSVKNYVRWNWKKTLCQENIWHVHMTYLICYKIKIKWCYISICTIYCIVSILYFWLKDMTCILYYFLLLTVYFMHYFICSLNLMRKNYLSAFQDAQFYRHKAYQYVLLNTLNKGKWSRKI